MSVTTLKAPSQRQSVRELKGLRTSARNKGTEMALCCYCACYCYQRR